MFYFEETFYINIIHRVETTYISKEEKNHGHMWKITIFLKDSTLDQNGYLWNSILVKDKIKNELDNKIINKDLRFNPTMENVARYILQKIEQCYKVTIEDNNLKISYEE